MKEEIKEIIDRMQELVKHKYDKKIHTYNLFDDIQGLLDYITNLQEENERLREVVENLTTMTVCGDRKQIKNTAQFKLEQCQSRIDKAVDYIKDFENKFKGYAVFPDKRFLDLEELLSILNGGDEE